MTEPDYLKGLARGNKGVSLVVKPASSPKGIVETARKLRDAARKEGEAAAYDEVWCVFDVDEHAGIEHAKQLAGEHDIELAISNPCFELFLLLHFQDQGSSLTCRKAGDLCREHMPGYRKAVPFSTLSDRIERAVKRAADLDKRHANSGGNPSTGVHRLVTRIRSLGP